MRVIIPFVLTQKKLILRENVTMVIERTTDEIVIRLPSNIDTAGLQQLVDYLTYKEATVNSFAEQADVDKLANDVRQGWWAKNRSRFIQ
jgi:hypothetical protein